MTRTLVTAACLGSSPSFGAGERVGDLTVAPASADEDLRPSGRRKRACLRASAASGRSTEGVAEWRSSRTIACLRCRRSSLAVANFAIESARRSGFGSRGAAKQNSSDRANRAPQDHTVGEARLKSLSRNSSGRLTSDAPDEIEVAARGGKSAATAQASAVSWRPCRRTFRSRR